MSDDNKEEKAGVKAGRPLSRPGRLELKKTVETGQVRQSFSHGRSRAVTVEVKRKRTYATDEGGKMAEIKAGFGLVEEAAGSKSPFREATPLNRLTREEQESRFRALEGARHHAETAPPAESDHETLPAAEALSPASEAAASLPVEAVVPIPVPVPDKEKPARVVEKKENKDTKEGRDVRRARRDRDDEKGASARTERRRRSGRLTISQALDESGGERMRSLAAMRRAREKEKEKQKAREKLLEPTGKIIREVILPETITVSDLANRMAERAADVIKKLMGLGIMATINQAIDADTAELVIHEFGHKLRRVSESDVEIGLQDMGDDEALLKPCPPVVTIMGHVDHGKTSLLDALRSTDVVGGEAGGITQHIGAYQVTMKSGDRITFLDTPGHEAFTAMRARGAKATDIVVLVVAADDGIKEQTVEAIAHARAANVPMIIAINKIDKPGADPNRVRTELLSHNVVVEKMGGDILDVEVSAKQKTNLDKLEEAILLQAEILDLKSNPDSTASGVVIEAKIERGRGSVSTVLVQRGTLKLGDLVIAGTEWGRVRALHDDKGHAVNDALPATPVEILGLNGVPSAGDSFVVVESEARAREIADYRARRRRAAVVAAGARGSIEDMMSQISAGAAHELPVVVKADVQGSVEAIIASFEKLKTSEVSVRVLHSGVGGINESDVTLARASNALIIGFNVRANPQARDMARKEKVEIRYYSIIYDVINDLKAALGGMLSPTLKEKFLGNAEIREVFTISKVGKVAGCMVTEGMVKRGAKVRLLRDSVVVHEGELSSLKRFKDEVKEVREGYECGLMLEKYQDIQAGDIVECYEIEEIARIL